MARAGVTVHVNLQVPKTLAVDRRAVFGMTPSLRHNAGFAAPASSFSDLGRAVLLCVLANDYRGPGQVAGVGLIRLRLSAVDFFPAEP
jgi:hypothetical protein